MAEADCLQTSSLLLSDAPLSSETDSCVSDALSRGQYKRSRKNTAEEKRLMRRERQRRQRKTAKLNKRRTDEVLLYKHMARTFWDRWQWELQKRKEAVQEQLLLRRGSAYNCKSATYQVQSSKSSHHLREIDPSHLANPTQGGKSVEKYLGRGSFSVVRLQMYRGIKVAVKEFLPRSFRSDVQNEARLLEQLCHPYLPYVFGICTTAKPFRIVTQFHGIEHEAVTLYYELTVRKVIKDPTVWMLLCTQLLEALNYLHTKVNILHNDIKSDNILLTIDPTNEGSKLHYHIVLTDFGKATEISSAKKYNLSEPEKVQYLVKYPHIAPEVIHGDAKQSTYSDMYSTGMLFLKIFNCGRFAALSLQTRSQMKTLIENCRSIISRTRPSAKHCLHTLKRLFSE